MKSVLLSTVALVALGVGAGAADLPVRAAPAAVVPVFTWTGFYLGLNAGYAFGSEESRGRLATPNGAGGTFRVRAAPGAAGFAADSDEEGGFTGGGQVGYNMQFGLFVAGVEADIQALDLGSDNGSNAQGGLAVLRGVQPAGAFGIGAPTLGSTNNVAFFERRQEMDVFGTVRGRLGVAFDRALIYATGGLAWTSLDDGNRTAPTAAFFTSPGAFNRAQRIANASRAESDDIGFTVGGGVEYAFTRNITARIEGLYVNIESSGSNVVGVTNRGRAIRQTGGNDETGEFGLVRTGLNFRFDTF